MNGDAHHGADAPCVVELDLRALPAPEPMLRILERLENLAPGETLLARTPCRPQPLLERLRGSGWRTLVAVTPAGDARVWIQREHEPAGA